MQTGPKLWERAKVVIPGANMLLSKRAELFLPGAWPSYFSKTSGCKVWDLDGREYIDVSIMGIGTNTLGYSHPDVDEAVRKVVEDGNMSTFNCPEEVYLAEELVAAHPWSGMARFARSGGEANAIAVRIARAYTGKDKVAICGYHGWHDWYLSTNISSQSGLDQHLLPGLSPQGVPKALKGTVLPFEYNKIEQVEEIIANNPDLAAIKMEVQRNTPPMPGYLEKIRDLTHRNNIILIFDECTSGFRETYGGLHKKYNVYPDIAVFGKALGNGYAISAVIGQTEIMQAAQSSFISSTFWTERIGPSAALATLQVMKEQESWLKISETGSYIRDQWTELANKYGLPITINGIPAISSFAIKSDNFLIYKTYITQQMLKQGILASNIIFTCLSHSREVVDYYISQLDPIFAVIRDCEDGMSIDTLLDGEPCHDGFKRLN